MRHLLFSILCLMFISCKSEILLLYNYKIGEHQNVTVGSSIMSWTTGTRSASASGLPTLYGITQELIFSGIENNVLHITYREYSLQSTGSYARPSFYQDLVYDIVQSDMIEFRDVVIKIDSANTRRLYFVINNHPLVVSDILKVHEKVITDRIKRDSIETARRKSIQDFNQSINPR